MIIVSLIAAQTQDGFIARMEGENSLSWTSVEDKKRFVELTKRAKVLVMGRKTFATIRKGLPGRTILVYTRHPRSSAIPGVEYTALPPKELLKTLEIRGFTEVAICGGAEVYDLFLRSKLIDQLFLTIEPIAFGSGIPLLKNPEESMGHFTLLREETVGNGTIFRDFGRT
jgi:dihydrofolate reductase